jgi:chorismate mutase
MTCLRASPRTMRRDVSLGDGRFHRLFGTQCRIRPQLDEVQKSLIAELVDTVEIHKSKTCHADLTKVVRKYVSTHVQGDGPISAATPDRA